MFNQTNIPTIPQSLIKRSSTGSSDERKSKDTNRCPNVSAILDDYITEFNSNSKNESGQKLIPFSNKLDNKQRNRNARIVIKNEMGKNLNLEWFDGTVPFNQTYQLHKLEFEQCISEIRKLPEMEVYNQASSDWAIKKFIEDITTNKRNTVNKSNRVQAQLPLAITAAPNIRNIPDSKPLTDSYVIDISEAQSTLPSTREANVIELHDAQPPSTLQAAENNRYLETHSNNYDGVNKACDSLTLATFKEKVYNQIQDELESERYKILENHLNNDDLWKKVAQTVNSKQQTIISKEQLQLVRQAVLECLSYSHDKI